ncbi:unnamed protein product [Amoebophrya sp. A25]|nr:unnamed protein product [Amoebophrya sp. A25]|eukprot:GSA25T00026371001.1
MKKLGHELEEFLEALAEHDEVAVGAAELEGKQEDNGRKGGGRKRRRKIIEQDAEKVVHELNHLEGGTQVSTSAASFSTTAPLSTSTSPTTNTTSSDVSPPMFPRITEDRLKELKVGELRLWLDVLRGFSNDFKPRSKLTKADLIKELLRLEEIVIAAQDKAARIKIGDRTTQEIVIPGFGLTPTALTQKGWPSVSRESLLAVAKQATKDAETATISADRDEDVELEYNKKKGQDQDDDEEASSSSEQGLPTRTSPPPFDPSLTDWLENNGILQGFMLPLANYAKSYTKRGTSTGGGSTSSSTSSSSTSSSSTSSSTSSSKDDRAREIPRIFMNLNLYTETGRLACRHPNLQNVPTATRKYNLRECFSAAPGKTFVIVDYSQLELRVLAHLTSCRSMLDGFLRGGDFHSRTAMNMFPHIKEEYERRSREKRLTTSTGGGDHSTTSSINSSSFSSSSSTTEGSHEQDEDDIAFVKEKYPVERKKAKTLNFSVVYGATKHGLAKTLQLEGGTEEAQQIIDLWYKNFPEVLKWQQQTVEHATRYGYVETLLGRRRWIPDMMAPYKGSSGAGLLSAWGRSANRAGIPVTSPLYSAAAAGDHQGQGYSNNNSANSSPFGTPWRGPISWQRRKHLERVCSNTPVQGSAADVVTSAMIQLHKSKLLHDLGFVQVLQVHDELVLEGPKEHAEEARAEVVRLAENAQVGMMLKLQCPLLVDSKISETWC